MTASFGAYYLPGPLATLAGLWLILGAPTVFWVALARRVVSRMDSALLLAFGFAVVTDFAVLLLVNFGAPLVGYSRPLAEVPLAAGFALVDLVIGSLSPECGQGTWARIRRVRLPGVRIVAGYGALCVVLAVAGATRLNNGLGPQASMLAYTAIAGMLALLLIRHNRYAVEVLELGVFLGAAALLLLTSLRGWLITGHDIQVEYEVYRLNLGGGHWVIADYPTSYNACLSITLLPLALTKLTAISATGVWKIVFPLMFAVAPVALFRSVHNLASRQVALLSSALFLTFPTFFTDMAYMARQEIAFVILGAAAVVMSEQHRDARLRRYAMIPLLAGIVLAHYATAYVLVMVLGSGVVVTTVWRLLDRIGERRRTRAGRRAPADIWDYGDWDYVDDVTDSGDDDDDSSDNPESSESSDNEAAKPRSAAPAFLTVWLVALTAVLAVAWAGPITHTSGQLTSTLFSSWQEVIGHSSDVGSADTSNSLVGGSHVTDDQRMAAYLAETRASTAHDRDQGLLYPQDVIDKAPTPVTAIPDLPLTSVGTGLQRLGLPVASLNGLVRFGIAAAIQLLLVIGTAVALLGLRYRRIRAELTPSRDQAALAVGSIAVLVLLTLVPQLTVDYSVLRALQQGIFFFGPFMAAGLLWALRWCGRYRTPVLATVLAVMAVDLTGVVPRLTGGYPPQLALSDSGQYYDEYYPTPEELDAAAWLQSVYDHIPPDAQQTMLLQTSQDVFERIQSVYIGPAEGTVDPLLLRPGSYVMLGHAEVDQDRASIDYRGTAVPYVYPTALLEDLKDKIYVSPGVEIYR
ncbi:DUF2206 domain-containing protein [Catenulispora sp. NF23]|uniref:DUF2206 domain-containing protein n=1 Tax=Catenulispora pinistramenti TaxID=2705254 RepID=A0ABS5KSE8_9ACTN|nr:DUF2206 domain-containing protein [Catenulispora pinistramenti]MBS2532692.1 DUF2206 domain-containing protein [Catenulispora pinistramenti]MBS2548961.1 DUF2206 domain-containing protein [Catenulispora pinistramenti]